MDACASLAVGCLYLLVLGILGRLAPGSQDERSFARKLMAWSAITLLGTAVAALIFHLLHSVAGS